MSQHISTEPRRVHPKPKGKGAAHAVVHHERRHKTTEGKAGYIGAGCTITNITYQTNTAVSSYYPGIVTDGNGLRAYNASGVMTMQISAADGSVSVLGSGTITGGTIQTSTTNPRVVMDGTGLRAYNSAGTQTFNLSAADGSLVINNTGILTGATIQTSATNPRVVLDSSGIRAYDGSGTQQVTISNLGTFSLGGTSSSITAATSGVTISSSASTATGARVVVDATGIKGYNASNTRQFLLDATTGLITATGVISAQPGSTVPWQTTGFSIGGGNLLPNASAEDPTATTQVLYLSQQPITINMVEVNSDGTRKGSSGFETDTQGWTGASTNFRVNAGATLTRTTAQAHSGSFSLQVDNPANATTGADFATLAVTAGQTYTASVWLRGSVGGEKVALIIGDATVGNAVSPGTTLTTSWQRLTVTFTATASGTTGVAIRSAAATQPAQTAFVDDVQVEAGSTATSYSASRLTLRYGSGTVSGYIYANSTATQVQSALNAPGVLPTGVTASVSGGTLDQFPINISLSGFGTVTPSLIVVASQSLTGGSAVVGQAAQWTTAWPYGWPYQDAVDVISYASAFHGGKVFRLTCAISGQAFMGLPGPLSYGWTPGSTQYTMSAYFRAPVVARFTGLVVNWYNASGNLIFQASSPGSSWTTSSDQWQRLSYTFVVPPATTSQSIFVTGGPPTSGTFTLTYGGQTTAALNYNATAAQVQSALQALSSIGASGISHAYGGPLPGTPITVAFRTVSPVPGSITIGTNSLSAGTLSVVPDVAVSMIPYASITNPLAGEVFYIDALQLEVGDVATAFAPRPDEVLANTIQANMVNVAQLSAISANLGTITAGNIAGVTITGSTIQTSSVDPRTALDSTGFWATNSSSLKIITIDYANGIKMTGGQAAPNTIQWFNNNVGGTPVATIYASNFNSGASNQVFLEAFLPGSSTSIASTVGVSTNNTTDVGNSASAGAWDHTGVTFWGVTMVDGTGASSFVQMSEGHGIAKYRSLGTWSRGWCATAKSLATGQTSDRFITNTSYDPAGNFSSGYWYPGTSGDAIASMEASFPASALSIMHAELWDGTTNTMVERGPYIVQPSALGNASVYANLPFQCTVNHAYFWRIVCDAFASGTANLAASGAYEYEAFKQVA